MQSGKQESFLNITQKAILVLFFGLIITFLLIFKNVFFQPAFLLKSFGELSIDPEIAFTNNKPTFLEFYAEWCEVCKEMAPKVGNLREEYANDINFVFLNVDNPKWESYIRDFNVNGIPQINLLDKKGVLETSLIGKQDEKVINGLVDNLKRGIKSNKEILNSDLSTIKENKNNIISPRSHA